LEALRRNDTSEDVKILNLRKLLAQAAAKEGSSKPYLVPIGERAEKLAELYESRQVNTQQALDLFMQIAKEAVDAGAEISRLGIDQNTYAILIAVRPIADGMTVDQAKTINAIFEKYPEYAWNEQQRNLLRLELYKNLRPIVGAQKMVDAANTILNLTRI
jgi:type I restriction enzyme, R subunit